MLPAIVTSLLPSLIGGVVSGLGGSAAAAPANAGAEEAARAQADMINALVQQYQGTFAPAQSDIMSQLMGLSGQLPMSDIVNMQFLQNLLPTMMPDVLRARAEQRVRDTGFRELAEAERDLIRRGIDPNSPAGRAALQQIRERTLMGLHGVGSEAMTWEANQTLGNRDKAFQQALSLLGMAGDYSKIGSAMPGTAISGASNLAGMFGQAAQGAAAPWQAMGGNIANALQAYFANPSYSGSSGTVMLPEPLPGGGGSGGLSMPRYM